MTGAYQPLRPTQKGRPIWTAPLAVVEDATNLFSPNTSSLSKNLAPYRTAQQLREATPFGEDPRFLIRDNDREYGTSFERVASGIELPGRTLCVSGSWAVSEGASRPLRDSERATRESAGQGVQGDLQRCSAPSGHRAARTVSHSAIGRTTCHCTALIASGAQRFAPRPLLAGSEQP